MKTEVQKVIDELNDHLLAHPFFETTVRALLDIPVDADVTENEEYHERLTHLVDETLTALIALNRAGENKN